MKTPLILLLIFVCSYSFSQKKTEISDQTPGDYLMIAKKHKNISMVVSVIGVAGTAALIASNPTGNIVPACMIGGLSAIVSTLFSMSAWQNVGKAGELMNREKLDIETTSNGLSLVYRF